MTTLSTNLSLKLYNATTDQSGSFLTWQQDMSGSSNSNMTKIDAFAGNISGSITTLGNNISGSVAALNTSMSDISGSIVSINSSITSIGLKFSKLAEFSGAGLADFTSIPATYTHLLIMGVAAGNKGVGKMYLGIDFNGDANSSNYAAVVWNREQIGYSLNHLSGYTTYAQAIIGNIPGTNAPGYGGTFFGLIPNYSVAGGFYKSAIGFSSWIQNSNAMASGNQGGTWLSTAAINRVRAFATDADSYRYSFLAGTKISLYGIG